jgi:hypothetical protein
MKERWQHITYNGKCPDEATLMLYHDGALSSTEMFQVENHLASCDMCRDFAEGLLLISSEELTKAEIEIKEKIAKSLDANKKLTPIFSLKRIAVAASVLLVIALGSLFFIQQQPDAKEELAYQQEVPELITSPPLLLEEELKVEDLEPVILPSRLAPVEITHSPELQDLVVEDFDVLEIEENLEVADVFVASAHIYDSIQDSATEQLSGINLASIPSQKNVVIRGTTTLTRQPASAGKVIQGKVTTASSDEPLPGVVVLLKGSSNGTLTDVDGNFELQVPTGTETLEFSFIGFNPKTIKIDNNQQIEVKMEESLMALSEVVVVGYGTRNKRSITASSVAIQEESSEKEDLMLALKTELKHNPDDHLTLIKLTKLNLQENQKSEALAYLTKLQTVITEPNDTERLNATEQFIQSNRFARAIRELNKWIGELE